MKHCALAVALIACALPAAAQVALGQITISCPGGTAPGWVAYIDLKEDVFTPVVPRSANDDCRTATCQHVPAYWVQLLDTQKFAKNNNTFVAITANTGRLPTNDTNYTCACTASGLIYNDGVLVNPPQDEGPTLFFFTRKTAGISGIGGTTLKPLPPLNEIQRAVAGTISSPDSKVSAQLEGNATRGGWRAGYVRNSETVRPRRAKRRRPDQRRHPDPRDRSGIDQRGPRRPDHRGLRRSDDQARRGERREFRRRRIDRVHLDAGGERPVRRNELKRKARHTLDGVQYCIEWKNPALTYEIPSCTDPSNHECTMYRAVYASLGLQEHAGADEEMMIRSESDSLRGRRENVLDLVRRESEHEDGDDAGDQIELG